MTVSFSWTESVAGSKKLPCRPVVTVWLVCPTTQRKKSAGAKMTLVADSLARTIMVQCLAFDVEGRFEGCEAAGGMVCLSFIIIP